MSMYRIIDIFCHNIQLVEGGVRVRRILRYMCLFMACVFIVAMAVHAMDDRTVAVWRPYMYTHQEINRRQQGLEIRGQIPVITEEFGPQYARLNEAIETAVDSLADGSRRIRARSVSLDFQIHSTHEVVSVVIHATSRAVTDRTSVTSVNFNPRTGAIVDLTDAMGRDITPLVRGIIADMIRRNPATYYAAFTAPPTGQAFYLTHSNLVLLYDEFQLSSTPGATTEIVMTRANIRSFTLSPNCYHINTGPYAVKMIPLRTVLVGLGHNSEDITWVDNEARISRNGQLIITLRPSENNYNRVGVLQRSLEAAPELVNHQMYVPISFFDQILNLTTFSIDSQGNITFLAYMQ